MRPLGQREGVGDRDQLGTEGVCAQKAGGMEKRSLPWPSHSTPIPTTASAPVLQDQLEARSWKTRCLQVLAKYGDPRILLRC